MKMDNRLIAEKKQIRAKSIDVCENCFLANNCPMLKQYEPIAEIRYNNNGSFELIVQCFIQKR